MPPAIIPFAGKVSTLRLARGEPQSEGHAVALWTGSAAQCLQRSMHAHAAWCSITLATRQYASWKQGLQLASGVAPFVPGQGKQGRVACGPP